MGGWSVDDCNADDAIRCTSVVCIAHCYALVSGHECISLHFCAHSTRCIGVCGLQFNALCRFGHLQMCKCVNASCIGHVWSVGFGALVIVDCNSMHCHICKCADVHMCQCIKCIILQVWSVAYWCIAECVFVHFCICAFLLHLCCKFGQWAVQKSATA